MRRYIVALMSLFAVLYAGAGAAGAEPVEYVRVCDAFGANYFYSPGTDNCINAVTGEAKTYTEIGTMYRQTYPTARVRALESDYCDGCFAVIAANGGATEAELVKSSSRVGPGRFNVIFKKPVDQCAFNATIGTATTTGLQPPPGLITVARTPNTDKGVTVWTFNAGGSPADKPFHLSLTCNKKQPFCQVIDSNGTHACTGNEPVKPLSRSPGP